METVLHPNIMQFSSKCLTYLQISHDCPDAGYFTACRALLPLKVFIGPDTPRILSLTLQHTVSVNEAQMECMILLRLFNR